MKSGKVKILVLVNRMVTTFNPYIFLAIFIAIIMVISFIIWKTKDFDVYDKSIYNVMILIFIPLCIIITLFYQYSVVDIQIKGNIYQTSELMRKIIDNFAIRLPQNMLEADNLIPHFIASTDPLRLDADAIPFDPDTQENAILKQVISLEIFANWRQFLIPTKVEPLDYEPYLRAALQMANSKELYEFWLLYQINFMPTTVEFIDLLFEYGLVITEQIPASYTQAAHELVNDPRFLQIINNTTLTPSTMSASSTTLKQLTV